jgi:hypothetical protein
MHNHRSIRLRSAALVIAFAVPATATSQHEMHAMIASPLGIPMERMGSGTGWLPDAVSVPSWHRRTGSWDLMGHGVAFALYNRQSGDRGEAQAGLLNWGMLMASRRFAGGVFQARTMLSLEPWTVAANGYPLLLQTGEVYKGVPIRDRQHPHDLWMELGVLYERPISSALAWSLYAAPAGEPALGPVAFLHRVSAMDNPTTPLGHHWQDATHITYGVATFGVFGRKWKVEASAFNGREPDERRAPMDAPRLDSWSVRFTTNPSANWSATAGYGFLESPEALDPDVPTRRAVASIMHAMQLSRGLWASSFVVGANHHDGEWSSSTLAETEVIVGANTWIARGEITNRTAGDLGLAAMPPDATFRVTALSLGYVRDFAKRAGLTTGIGIRGTVNFLPASLKTDYGSRTPTGLLVFLRVRPATSVMTGM